MISIKEGSILDAETDAIVNAANGHLRHGGGLAAVIDRAAQGPFYGTQTDLRYWTPSVAGDPKTAQRIAQREAVMSYIDDHRAAPLIATGNVHVTSSGMLPQRAIIHAVGPIWNGGGYEEQALLESAHQRTFEVCLDEGFSSVAVPAISCGIFGFPPELAASVALSTAVCFEDELDIEFYPFGFEALYEAAAGRLGGS